jgi:uncharacterized protein (TIGR03435 family)
MSQRKHAQPRLYLTKVVEIVPTRIFSVLSIAAMAALSQDQNAKSRSGSAFDVVSIKLVPPDRSERFESDCESGGRFIAHGTPLLWSIKWAFGMNDYQMRDGWPAWLNSFGTYDIEAEAEGPVTKTDCRKMVQTLFEERFKLRMHRQTKATPAFALILAKSGPKFAATYRVTINGAVKQATSEREAPSGWTMARLANYLASVRGVQRPVVDRTMLNGIYGFTLNYSIADGDDRPDIFTALPEQLGLRLQAIRAPIEMWVVDHVERPSAN